MTLDEELRMTEFVAERVNQSDLYTVTETGPDYVVAEGDIFTRGEHIDGSVHVQLHKHTSSNGGLTVEEAEDLRRENLRKGRATAHAFYKAGDFFQMAETEREGKRNRSLKNYAPEEVDDMIHLRGLEKLARDQHWASETEPTLTYLDQETPSIEVYRLAPATLDRRHLTKEEREARSNLPIEETASEIVLPRLVIEIDEGKDAKLGIHDREKGYATLS